jgi:uncharacterized protein YukE
VAGEVPAASGSTLLPSSLRSRVQGSLPAPASVTFGGIQAYRYSNLRISGLSSPATVYAAPTSAGVATIACFGTAHLKPDFATQCSEVTATLRLISASSYPLGASASYARKLTNTFNTLRSATNAPLSQLKTAATQSGQSTAARHVSSAYSSAATTLSDAAVSPRDRDANNAVVSALKQISTGYSRASSAAASGSNSAYSKAQKQINSGSSALSSALRQLSALGYKVG